jgi:ammonia channel protein AmtB
MAIGMRVSEKEEVMGIDLTQHREAGYTVLE